VSACLQGFDEVWADKSGAAENEYAQGLACRACGHGRQCERGSGQLDHVSTIHGDAF
jgi:hypothetical protein